MYIGLHARTRYSCQILIKLEFPRHVFEKDSNIKFHENPSSGRSCSVRTDGRTDIKTDMTKLTVAILRTRVIRISGRWCLMTLITIKTTRIPINRKRDTLTSLLLQHGTKHAKPRQPKHYTDFATGRTIWGSNLVRGKKTLFLQSG